MMRKFMDVSKGEDRIIVQTFIMHIGNHYVGAPLYSVIKEPLDITELARCIEESWEVITSSQVSTETAKEMSERSIWKRATKKCKSYKKFWQNYNMAVIELLEDDSCRIYAYQRNMVDKYALYNGCVKEILLPQGSTCKAMAEAVMDVLLAAEEFYGKEQLEWAPKK
ncbi:MAG: hypothetical protein IJB96_05475 [Lachnospira sp.]|nr:hypothetical protein [Lachnospira sp.]